jgi:thiamine transporter ThiT
MLRTIVRIGVIAMFVLAYGRVYAQPQIYCQGLPGCSSSAVQWLDYVKPLVEFFMLPSLSAAFATLFVILGALYLVLNLGDEQRAETGKKTILWSLIGLSLALFAREFVLMYLAGEQYADQGAPNQILQIVYAFIRILKTFINVALLIAIIVNALRMIFSGGADEQFTKAKTGFFYAFLGAVALNVYKPLITAVCGAIGSDSTFCQIP